MRFPLAQPKRHALEQREGERRHGQQREGCPRRGSTPSASTKCQHGEQRQEPGAPRKIASRPSNPSWTVAMRARGTERRDGSSERTPGSSSAEDGGDARPQHLREAAFAAGSRRSPSGAGSARVPAGELEGEAEAEASASCMTRRLRDLEADGPHRAGRGQVVRLLTENADAPAGAVRYRAGP